MPWPQANREQTFRCALDELDDDPVERLAPDTRCSPTGPGGRLAPGGKARGRPVRSVRALALGQPALRRGPVGLLDELDDAGVGIDGLGEALLVDGSADAAELRADLLYSA